MRNRLSTFAAALAFAVAPSLWTSQAAAVDVLRLGGKSGASGLMVHLGQAFTQWAGITVKVVPGLGSVGSLNALAEGVLDVAIAGRSLSPAQLKQGFVQVATVRTPWVLVTSHPAPPALTGRDVVDAYSADRAVWPDGTPLRIVLRSRSDADHAVLAATISGMGTAMDRARQRGDASAAGNDQDNATIAENLPGSLADSTYTQVLMERRNLRFVPFDNVAPTLEALESGAYPYDRVFRLILPPAPSVAAQRFIHFLRTEEGVRAMREAGCLPGDE